MKVKPLFYAICVAGMFVASCQAVENRYSPKALKESVTHENPDIQYEPGVLVAGMSRERVMEIFGPPNGSDTLDNGLIEDVYIFMPDGAKYVSPTPRARNVALGVVTMGTSVVVHQALLAHQRTKLKIYHVYYNARQRISHVEELSGSAFENPTKVQNGDIIMPYA
jgi:hypothetical protein